MMATVTLFVLLAILLMGVPVGFALAGLGLALLYLGDFSPLIAAQGLLSSIDNFVLLAVPLFLLMSNILLRGGVGHDLFAAVQAWVGRLPGGLAIATILSCGLFAAISGSSVATAATIGTVAIPEMIRFGYPRNMVLGLLAAGGTLGILIPPSIPMIIYGYITGESIFSLFLAGIGPGLVLMLLFIGYAMAYARYKGIASELEPVERAVKWQATRRALPALSLAVIVIAGIYAGVFTPTEAAAVGFVGAVIITTLVLRTLTMPLLKLAGIDAMRTTVAILLVIAGAKVFGKAITLYRIPHDISEFIIMNFSEAGMFLLVVSAVLVVMGLFLEALSMMLIVVPVLAPSLLPLGLDPIWFGIFFVIMIECALITPPVGLNLYVIQSVADARMGEICAGVWPFLVLMLITALLCYWIPGLVLYIPFSL